MTRRNLYVLALLCLCPIGFAAPPEGFEFVNLMSGNKPFSLPRMNDCGQVVVARGYLFEETEVFLYDNGVLTQMTDNRVSDDAPDINDEGTMTWMVGYDGFHAGEIVIFRNGERSVLAAGKFPSINNLGHIVWRRSMGEGCRGLDMDVYFYDGESVRQITHGGLSNQTVTVNDLDQIAWISRNRCVEPVESAVVLYSDGRMTELPSKQDRPSVPSINNAAQVAWGGNDGLELWENGATRFITDWGRNPKLNNHGDIFFLRWYDEDRTWQGWLYTNTGEFLQLTDDPFSNTDGDMNDWGEIVWRWRTSNGPRGVRMMRRIRSGDSEFDGDIDLIDYAQFAACMTGPEWAKRKDPGPHDSLCDCRFLDINHDGSVDLKDFAIFQRNFTGSE